MIDRNMPIKFIKAHFTITVIKMLQYLQLTVHAEHGATFNSKKRENIYYNKTKGSYNML